MSIVTDVSKVRAIYAEAAERGWVIPCFCTENLTTTEAILTSASRAAQAMGIANLPVILAITCRYSHRPQAVYYTNTRRWDTGLKLFLADIGVLAGPGGPFEDLRVMVHLDHIQYDDDLELLEWDLSPFSSIMYDASALPFAQNVELTARFVQRRGSTILIEGACDEIIDAGGNAKNALTTAERAAEYIKKTGVDLIVANLGTEHRAGAKNLQYHPDAARAIQSRIGSRIVLHGTSSVSNEQVRNLFADGVCKVNIWTTLERDSAPALLERLVKHAGQAAGSDTAQRLQTEGWLGERCDAQSNFSLEYCSTTARQGIVFEEMCRIAGAYFAMWYTA